MKTAYGQHCRRLSELFRQFTRDTSGVSLIEFALVVPVMIFTLLGMFDMGRYMLLNQKLDRAAATMSDLVSRPSNITAAEVNQLMIAAVEIVQPFNLGTNGGVIVTSVYKNPGDNAEVTWQITGAGPTLPPSQFGGTGDTASLPGGFIVRDNENVIAVEVYFDYEPVFLDTLQNLFGSSSFIPDGVIVQTALRQPRLGDLSTLSVP